MAAACCAECCVLLLAAVCFVVLLLPPADGLVRAVAGYGFGAAASFCLVLDVAACCMMLNDACDVNACC